AEAPADGRALRRARRDYSRPTQRGAPADLAGDGDHHPLRHAFDLRGGIPRPRGAAARGAAGPRARARRDRSSRAAPPRAARDAAVRRTGRALAAHSGDLLMADSIVTAPLGGAFAQDREAQARFDARQRRLLWRKRLLPIVALVGLVLAWWLAVV